MPYSNTGNNTVNRGKIVLQFITYNGFGNNLYIDNVIVGRKNNIDIAVTSINNIPIDTSVVPDTLAFYIMPQVTVSNIGLTGISAYRVIMEIGSVQYISIHDSTALAAGQSANVTFDSLLITPGTPLDIMVYTSLASDTNHLNDTLKQYSIILAGYLRNVLFEEFTSATSPSSGSQNLYLDSFINNNFSLLSAVRYHLGFPQPGIDSMYLQNPSEPDARRLFYFIQSVPQTLVDGNTRMPLPYSMDSNLYMPLISRLLTGTPVSISVVRRDISPDSVSADVNISVKYQLPMGDYSLMVAAVERYVNYSSPPGASGETVFFDVFRKMLPDTNGIPLSLSPGNYQFSLNYQKNPQYVDSLIYFVAFVQNNFTREILNCAKSRNYTGNFKPAHFTRSTKVKPDFSPLNTFRIYRGKSSRSVKSDTTSYFAFQNFEGPFPPPGWIISNSDGYLTFEKVRGVNGVSLGGSNCVKVNFYDYYNIGQKDTLISVEIDSVSAGDTLYFDYAYAQYLSSYIDSLAVNISTDGGATYSNIFNKGGYVLATSLATTLPFVPATASDWKTVVIPMTGIIPPGNPSVVVPNAYELMQNYPNPFNPRTTIAYKIPYDVNVTIKIYDVLGKEIAVPVNKKQTAGSYRFEFDGSGLSSGIYFYRITAGGFSDVKKMALIR